MKKFIKFIFKLLIKLIILSFILLLSFAIYILIHSLKNDTSMQNSISYVKTTVSDLSDLTFTNKDLVDLSLENTTNTPTTIESTYINNKFYYNQLDDNAKLIYITLENNINNLKLENYVLDFSTKFNALLNESNGQYKMNKCFQSALDAFIYDHPELFYLDITKISLNIKSISIGSKTTYKVSLSPRDGKNYLTDFFNNASKVNSAISNIESIKANVLNNVSSKKDDYNKIKSVHDILVNSLEYSSDVDNPNTRNIYGALIEKDVVCEGYAKAFKYILDSLNIECILVSGTATNSSNQTESHMWNYVKLNDNWYAVDVTWDDPIIIGGTSSKIIRHDYFCKGRNSFNMSHNPSGKISDTGMLFNLPKLNTENFR